MELRLNGDTQRYRLVADAQTPQNEPTTKEGPGEENPQNEPNPPAGALRVTFASTSVPAMVHVHALEIPVGAGTPLTAISPVVNVPVSARKQARTAQ